MRQKIPAHFLRWPTIGPFTLLAIDLAYGCGSPNPTLYCIGRHDVVESVEIPGSKMKDEGNMCYPFWKTNYGWHLAWMPQATRRRCTHVQHRPEQQGCDVTLSKRRQRLRWRRGWEGFECISQVPILKRRPCLAWWKARKGIRGESPAMFIDKLMRRTWE
ncbi:hypothetical protein GOP47_0024900 [Adiantum capillus-veneris]|uniref:Uncharacterized protein n=1 Tax=Adiantum capillus-veneris TaxID=13818 RepID=A0A9D4U3P5_ADICA|nr:hypothetical protein GOP47_0024900 [Adiantum capillus-veneris]